MPRDVTILTEADLRQAVPLDLAAIDVVEQAFGALATGDVVMPPVLSMDLPQVHGEVDVKAAYLPGFDGFAIKVSPGFFNNPALGLPSLNGLMILFSATTGLVEALLLDNGYLTDVRTAAAGAVAARHLAPAEVETAVVFGTGVQARLQVQAAHLVRPFSRALVWGRNPEKARACAADLSDALGISVAVALDPARAVAEAQLVVTTTPSRAPIMREAWAHPGQHITAMGSDQAGKCEIAPELLARADLYVADRISQCVAMGELRAAVEAGLMRPEAQVELGTIVAGAAPGRVHADQITLCDLTGTGAQDTAIATHALSRAVGIGTQIAV
ncbi:MAG: cyclodeaminase [Pseudomonadota bacterium]